MIRALRFGTGLAAGVLMVAASACSALGQSSSPTGLTTRWSAENVSGAGDSPTQTQLADGLVVATSPDGDGLTARSLSSGHTEWSWTASAPPSGYRPADVSLVGSPAGATGVIEIVYWHEGNSTFQGFQDEAGINLANGHITWKHTTQMVLDSGGAQSAELIATIDSDNPNATYVEADSVATGKPAWSTESNPALKSCGFQGLAISGSLVYGTAICSGSKVLYGLSASTGAIQSKITLDDSSACDAGLSVRVESGYLLVDCNTDKPSTDRLLELRPGSSRQLVLYSGTDEQINGLVDNPTETPFFVSGSTLYFSTESGVNNGGIDAVDLTSGKRLWQQSSVRGSLIGVDKDGALAAIDGDPSKPSLRLATLSADSGSISYGPGTTLDSLNEETDLPTLSGHTLLVAGDASEQTPTVAYSTGSWPN